MTTLPLVNIPQHPPSSIIDEIDDDFSLSDRVSETASELNDKASLVSYSSCDERGDNNDEVVVLPSSDLTPIKSRSSSNNSNPQSGSIGTNSTKSNISPVPSTISEADSMSIRGACTGVDHQSEPAHSTCGDRSYTSTSNRANHPYEKDVRKVFVGGLARSGKFQCLLFLNCREISYMRMYLSVILCVTNIWKNFFSNGGYSP